MFLGQLQHDLLLRVVRVLILIDEYILKSLLVFLAHGLMVVKQTIGQHQQIVEIHRIRLSASLFVFHEDATRFWHFRILVATLHFIVVGIFCC